MTTTLTIKVKDGEIVALTDSAGVLADADTASLKGWVEHELTRIESRQLRRRSSATERTAQMRRVSR